MQGFGGEWALAMNHGGQMTTEFKPGKLEVLLQTHSGLIVAAYWRRTM